MTSSQVAAAKRFNDATEDIEGLSELLSDEDPEMQEMAMEDYDAAVKEVGEHHCPHLRPLCVFLSFFTGYKMRPFADHRADMQMIFVLLVLIAMELH